MNGYPTLDRSNPIRFLEEVAAQRPKDMKEIAQIQRKLFGGHIDTAAIGNAGSGEDDLIAYSLPDGILLNDNQRLEFQACITLAANANSKQIRAYFGSQQIYDSTAQTQNGGTIIINATVIRTSETTQAIGVSINTDASTYSNTANYVAGTQDLLSAVVFKCTGEAVSDNDIVQRYLTVKWFPGG